MNLETIKQENIITDSMNYSQYINYITNIIIADLRDNGWEEQSKNKVIVRYLANKKWHELTNGMN